MNPYKAYNKYPKYIALIDKLQAEGYEWKMGAFHAFYLMPPDSFMGCPSDVGGRISFIWPDNHEAEIAEVLDEIYGPDPR